MSQAGKVPVSAQPVWAQPLGAKKVCDGLIEAAAMQVRDARIVDYIEVVGVEGNRLADHRIFNQSG